MTQIRAFVGPRRSGEQPARTWRSYACAAPAIRTLSSPGRRRVAAVDVAHRRAHASLSLSPLLSKRSTPSRHTSLDVRSLARSLPTYLPPSLPPSIRSSKRVAARLPKDRGSPAGCVCYPASCLRTRVVKKILATGGRSGGGDDAWTRALRVHAVSLHVILRAERESGRRAIIAAACGFNDRATRSRGRTFSRFSSRSLVSARKSAGLLVSFSLGIAIECLPRREIGRMCSYTFYISRDEIADESETNPRCDTVINRSYRPPTTLAAGN